VIFDEFDVIFDEFDVIFDEFDVIFDERIHLQPFPLKMLHLRGCLKLQVIFCKKATNHRALLQKMTYKDKASYGSCPPCTTVSTENAASPKSTKSRNLDSLVSRGINSN
jgi:hypothetical protein